MKYSIKDYQEGLYEYDTIFIEKDNIEYQVPIKKGLIKPSTKDIEIESLDRPIDEIEKKVKTINKK